MEFPISKIQDIVAKLQRWEEHIPDVVITANMPIEDLNKFDALYHELKTCNEALLAFSKEHPYDIHLLPKLDQELHAIIHDFFNGPHSQELISRANTISEVFYHDPNKFAKQLTEFEQLINKIKV